MRCQLCNSDRFHGEHTFPGSTQRYRDQQFVYAFCDGCQAIVSLDERPVDYSGYPNVASIEREEVTRFTRLLNSLGVSSDTRMLDYGCGSGTLYKSLRERGYAQATGYDPHRAEHARALDGDAVFDLVSLVHVVEHVLSYDALLADLRRCTRVGSTVVLLGPSASRVQALDVDDPAQWLLVHAPFHAVVPTDAGYQALLERAGFKLKTSFPYDVNKSGLVKNSRVYSTLTWLYRAADPLVTLPRWRLYYDTFTKIPLRILREFFFGTHDALTTTLVFERTAEPVSPA